MKSKSLRTSMRFLYITSILIPFFVVSTIYSYYFSMQILSNNKKNISNTLESISSGIGIYVAELNSISNVPYLTPEVQNTMEEINSGKYQDIVSSSEFLQKNNKFRLAFLKQIYNATQNISDIRFIPEDNPLKRIYIMSRNADETQIISNDDYKKEYWYFYLQTYQNKTIFYPVYENLNNTASFDNSNELTKFTYAKIIRDVDTKKNIGIIQISIPSTNITKLINQVNVSSLSSIAISSSDGEIIYTKTDNSRLSQLKNINDLSTLTTAQYQIIKKPIENTSFQLIYLSSTREVLYFQILTYSVVFFITLATLFISFFIYRHKADKITKSVSNIKDSFERIETGDLTAKCTVSDQKEFIEISNAFNHMTQKLNEYIIKEYKANISQQEAEYRALQAQINPHFLYNTLNGFVALNRMGEKHLLEKSIIQLTHLFQYTCRNSTITSIESELGFIQQYLELQSLKYDERLTFSIYMEEGTEAINIPKLLIQPLIENSIIHGLEPSDVPIHIQVETCIVFSKNYGKFLYIHVKDNGIGFDSSQLEFCSHIGIKNIHNRLNYHNAKNVFQIMSIKNQGTDCTILFKYDDTI